MGSYAAPVLVGNLQELQLPHPRRGVDASRIAELQVAAGCVVVVACEVDVSGPPEQAAHVVTVFAPKFGL